MVQPLCRFVQRSYCLVMNIVLKYKLILNFGLNCLIIVRRGFKLRHSKFANEVVFYFVFVILYNLFISGDIVYLKII